jgi:hypothetical protein
MHGRAGMSEVQGKVRPVCVEDAPRCFLFAVDRLQGACVPSGGGAPSWPDAQPSVWRANGLPMRGAGTAAPRRRVFASPSIAGEPLGSQTVNMESQRSPRRDEWFLSPLASLVGGLPFAGLAVWMFAIGDGPTAVFFLLIAALMIPGALANSAFRRRLHGDPRPFREQPVFRFQSLIFGVAAAAFLLVAVWARRTGSDPLFAQIGGLAIGGFLALMAVVYALLPFVERVAKRLAAREARGANSDLTR